MKTILNQNEAIVKEGPANLQRGLETVGGKLFLTDHRLIFEPHKVNVQTGTTEISLSAIKSATPCWTKFLGILPLAPNSLAVVRRMPGNIDLSCLGETNGRKRCWASAEACDGSIDSSS